MKALVIILLVVAAICFFIEFIWSKALGEREDKLKNDQEILKGAKRMLEIQRAELLAQKNSIDKRTEELAKTEEKIYADWMQLEGQKDYYALMEKAYNELKAEKEAKKTKKK